MTALHWYVLHDGHRLGPFTAAELQPLVASGMLRPNDLLWHEGLSGWTEASRFPTLFPPPGPDRYWLSFSGQTRGPFTIDQVRASLAAHQITLDTLACVEGSSQWVPLGQLPAFRSAVPASRSSQARLLSGTLDAEQAELYLAAKGGDALAKLILTLLTLQKTYADNPALVASLEQSIQVLRGKRQEAVGVSAG